MTIKCRWRILFYQFLYITIGAVVLGYLLRDIDLSEILSIPNISDILGPHANIFIFGIFGLVLGIFVLKEGWTHRIVLQTDRLKINSRLGELTIFYSNIKKIQKQPSFGVAFEFTYPEAILQSHVGKAKNRKIIQKTMKLYQRHKKGDFIISSKYIDIGDDRFVEEINRRVESRPRNESEYILQLS